MKWTRHFLDDRGAYADAGSGFRVQGSGSRVQGPGFRVQGSGCRVHLLDDGGADAEHLAHRVERPVEVLLQHFL